MTFARLYGNRGMHPAHEQWGRILRWLQRLRAVMSDDQSSDSERMDFLQTVLLQCFILRDWLGQPLPPVAVAAFQEHDLQLCRDVANGQKHLRLSRPSVDPDYLTVRIYEPGPLGEPASVPPRPPLVLVYCRGDHRVARDLWDLCEACVARLARLLEELNLLQHDGGGNEPATSGSKGCP